MNPPVPVPISEIATNNPGKELAWTFFAFFARFEYALKRTSRFLAANDAKANWDAFAGACDAKPDEVSKLEATGAWKFFQATPPRKQIHGPAGLDWSDPTTPEVNEPRIRWICRCLRIVRNNLFHGGKYPMMN